MTQGVDDILARALRLALGLPGPILPSLLKIAAEEIRSCSGAPGDDLAIAARDPQKKLAVGLSNSSTAASEVTVLALIDEARRSNRSSVIFEHRRDTLRFVHPDLSQSLVLSLPGDVSLWFGFSVRSCATLETIEAARLLGEEVCGWLQRYFGVIEGVEHWTAEIAHARSTVQRLQSLAHDARAPLTSLLYNIDKLPEARAGVMANLTYLRRLLDGFAPEPAGLDRSLSTLTNVPFLCRKIVSRFGGEAREKGLTLTLTSVSDTCFACADPLAVERILSNLIDNSLRCTDRGRVELRVESDPEWVIIDVLDTGPGIPQDLLPHLVHGGHGELLGATGWGLGLVSTRRKVEAVGGTLTIQNRVEGGAIVRTCLPRAWATTDVQPSECEADGGCSLLGYAGTRDDGCRGGGAVLLVDDDVEQANSLARVLSAQGLEVGTAFSIRDALDALSHRDEIDVLCDVNMPDGGAEALLRAICGVKRGTRVAVLSGEESDALAYRLAAQGASAFFVKPGDPDEIVTWIRSSGERAIRADSVAYR